MSEEIKMSERKSEENRQLLEAWRLKIEVANHNNIFCHCRSCGYEWVDSSEDAICSNCGSKSVHKILCWQFPDD